MAAGESLKKWKESNPERVRAHHAAYRSRQKQRREAIKEAALATQETTE